MNSTCTDITPTNCVIWNGVNIPCLGLCKGDSVSDIVVKLATKICELAAPTDLSSLSLQCVYDIIASQETGSRTLLSVLSLMASAECTLNAAIIALTLRVNNLSITSFIVDRKCFRQLDSAGNELPYTLNSTIEDLIIEACNNKSTVAALSGTVINLKNQVDNLNLTPIVTEPSITTCINPASLPSSVQVKNSATEYCNFRTILGNNAQIQTAISRLGNNINVLYQTFPGWALSASNFMQVINNYEIVINDLLGRITTIETNCCALTCDSIKMNFSISFVNGGVILLFRDIDGVKIPTGFTDNGSVMTITDAATGNAISSNLTIINNYQTGVIPLTGFTANGNITFSLAYKALNGTTSCNKCITKTVVNASGGCCIITNNGTTNGVIIYNSPINSSGS